MAKRRKYKKNPGVVLSLVLLGGAAAVGYFIYRKSKDGDASALPSSQTSGELNVPPPPTKAAKDMTPAEFSAVTQGIEVFALDCANKIGVGLTKDGPDTKDEAKKAAWKKCFEDAARKYGYAAFLRIPS